MLLHFRNRPKDCKEHLYRSVVKNRRITGHRVLPRQVLLLGELNGRQESAWRKIVEFLGEDSGLSSGISCINLWEGEKEALNLRPIYHPLERRIQAHIFVSFLACCLMVTLKARLHRCAGA
jgi:hypothetical protein